MGFKKILFGEKVPDKDDPKYKERYEKDVAAGKSFAQALHLDRAAACVQGFATRHSRLFLAIIFAFVLFSVGLSLYRMSQAVTYKPRPSSAVERQEKELRFRRHHAPQTRESAEEEPSNKSINPYTIEEYEAYGKD